MLGQMLGRSDMRVTEAVDHFDKAMLDRNLDAGRPVVAQVDAGLVQPGGTLQDRPHYVVIIGRDAQGNYQVLNPDPKAKEQYYTVSAERLAQAERAVWGGGGGLIAVGRYQGNMSEVDLARSNGQRSMVLGNRKGGGSSDKVLIEP
jgi:hypothetical protein